MADQPPPHDREREETVAWLEEEGIVTISAQRVYFEQIDAGLPADQAFVAAIQFTEAEEDMGL
jgi:hypothetical protein